MTSPPDSPPPATAATDPGRLSVWTAPDGWPHRRYDRRGTGRGRLLFQTGRADMIEKYRHTLDHFHAQGWDVTAFDWRGQGGSGRLAAGDVGHVEDFGLLVDDLAAFWRDWQRGDGPHVLVAHSMGGFLSLRALVEGRIDPAALVLVAPMLALRSPVGDRLGGLLARWQVGRGDPARAAWRRLEGERAARARQMRLTHDLTRFEAQQAWRAAHPDLCLGSPSWQWVAQAFAQTAALRADPRLDQLRTPVQFVLADADRLVDSRAAVRVANRMPAAELLRFGPESAHEILRELPPVRDKALAAIDAFLDSHAP